jgi:hypothetical protein
MHRHSSDYPKAFKSLNVLIEMLLDGGEIDMELLEARKREARVVKVSGKLSFGVNFIEIYGTTSKKDMKLRERWIVNPFKI